jgi:hypothetical protein
MVQIFFNDMQTWKSIELTHEGFPLLLRYPEKIDFDFNKALFPNLAVITHEFSKVSANGLPDPNYNDSLFHLDQDVRAAFEKKEIGQTMLIETFGGKRNYYIYIAAGIKIDEILATVLPKYPNEKLTWLVRPDSEWGFIKRYSDKYFGK